MNVDALVNDTDVEPISESTPTVSQVLEPHCRATPAIPPGFSTPAVPVPVANEPAHFLTQNASSSTAPTIPVVPATPVRPATPMRAQKGKHRADATASHGPKATETASALKREAATVVKLGGKTSSARRQLTEETPRETAADISVSEQKQDEQINAGSPVRVTPKSKITAKKAGVPATPDTSERKDDKDIATSATKSTTLKRQHPGKLDIAAATKLSDTEQSSAANALKTDVQPKNPRAVSLASTGSVPASPATASTGSPVKRSTAPRTLRVVPTPKTEIPPPLSAVSVSSLPLIPTVDKLRSRQASIASINIPGTPASELISDNASLTSASVSRPSSPTPLGGKVGSAPVRRKTKSQAKKDRQERARQILEEQALAMEEQTKSDVESIQAPIVGRKKKAKKPGTSSVKSTAAPAKSQPASPKPATIEDEEEEPEPRPAITAAAPKKGHSNRPSLSSPRKVIPQEPEESKERLQATAQSIIADLQKTGELLASTLEFFKPLSSSLTHAARTSQTGNAAGPADLKIHFSEADLDALAKKQPVRLNGQDDNPDSRTLITPQGKFFWGLTQELEEKALELERHIEELKGSARFHPRKQTAHSHTHHMATHAQSKDVLPAIATALKEAGAKLSKGGPSPSIAHQMSKLDPTSTLLGSASLPLPPVQASSSADPSMPWLDLKTSLPPVPPAQPQPPPQPQTPADAGAYLNQFVIPKTDNPSPNSARTEMAAVGGPPGAGMSNMSVNVSKIAKAAKVVAEGGALGTELEGMGVMAADLLGGVVVQGLEALVGAGLGFHGNHDLSVDGQGNITLGGSGLDVQGLVDVMGSGGGVGGYSGGGGGHVGRRGRKSVLSVDEAEQAMLTAKKDHEALEKRLAAAMKRNKKMVNGGGKA